MDNALFQILKIVHLISMATFFGAGLFTAGDIRRTLQLGAPHTTALAGRVKSVSMVMLMAGLLTLLSGLGWIFQMGGFGAVHRNIHIGLGLMLVLLVLDFALTRPTWSKINAVITSGGDLSAAKDLTGRIAMATGISHLLRLIILVLMVWRG